MIALEEAGIPFDIELIRFTHGEHKSPGFRKVNPKGKVPALAIDGRRGPQLPSQFKIPQRRPTERKSPLPDEWSEGGETIREIISLVEKLIKEN